MLYELTVKNFALIREANICFKDKLNILTGETGSGKSILIGSINLALGMRANKESIKQTDNDTVVSITFYEKDKNVLKQIEDMDIPIEDDGKIIIYRKITNDKNINKINDVSCTLAKIKSVTELLLDIYGQHDSEDLRKNSKHIMFLDDFIGNESIKYKNEISKLYDDLSIAKKELLKFNIDENTRLREVDLLKFEIEEIENAAIKENEEEELSEKYKIISNAKNIIIHLNNAKDILDESNVGKAIKELKEAAKYDESLNPILDSLYDCESIVNDSSKDLDGKIDEYDVDEETLDSIEKRLDLIRNITNKYNNSIEKMFIALNEKKNRLAVLENYEVEKENALKKLDEYNNRLLKVCKEFSDLRKKYAVEFTNKLVFELKDLGFLDVQFNIDFKDKEPTKDGMDDVTFYISLNIGEKLRPLSEVASGGELSRIMLSIKTILSNSFGTDTLIFDEVDAGISGITATKVATKLNKIAKNHQVICITHLPQIAAMADTQFKIEKTVQNDKTYTNITELDEDGMLKEIGRLISSDENLTAAVLANAKELKNNANKEKQ